MTDTNLLPCPFCGTSDLLGFEPSHEGGWTIVKCRKCGGSGPAGLATSEQEAIAWWNRRAQPASVPDEAESIDDRIRILSRKLGLARNHNPSPAQLRAAGIELVRPAPPKSPPAKR